MLNEDVLKALNTQINRELYSGYLYFSMAAYAHAAKLTGVANWFQCQAREELVHAQKIYDYVWQTGARVVLNGIDQPPVDFSSVLNLFELTLTHEKKVTGMINELVEIAKKYNDSETDNFLLWFVKEQVEEEESAEAVLNKARAAEGDIEKLMKLDAELSNRR
ncbi:MAG: ferritin [Candidatus Omnitrophota bacterium]